MGFISLILTLLTFAILARVILSFIVPLAGARPHPLLITATTFINQITEPILGPIRRVLPSFGRFDFSPMVALIVLWGIRKVLDSQF